MSYLTETKKRNLTTKQQAFLDNIIATEGDFEKVCRVSWILRQSLSSNKIIKRRNSRFSLLSHCLFVLHLKQFKLIQMVESDRPASQASQKLAAAQTILDRVGEQNGLQVDHNVQGGFLFYLPKTKY